MNKNICMIMISALAAAFFACSDETPLFDEMHRGRADVLERIEITPGESVLDTASYCQLKATGRYNGGSERDVTGECGWSSDKQDIAVVTGAGYVQARSYAGDAIITAQYGTLTASAKVKINITLAKIKITPASQTLYSTDYIYFTAMGEMLDGSFMDVTRQVDWSVFPPSDSDIDEGGFFRARKTIGSVTVQAFAKVGAVQSNKAAVTLDLDVLYVDGASLDIPGDGTKDSPYITIGRAVEEAGTTGASRINVAKGTYTESLIIKDKISLHGGYDNPGDGSEWVQDDPVVQGDTKIEAEPGMEYAVQFTSGLNKEAEIEGFRIIGGNDSALTTSMAILCNSSSPTIRNNEIYGGKSSMMSTGIKILSAWPRIIDNPVISGGLPNYLGGGANNIAIHCLSSSMPTIEGKTPDTAPTQTITGPTGGSNTWRIRCEGSSDARIRNNRIEITVDGKVAAAKGILANGSNPVIDANVIQSKNSYDSAIRCENSSLYVTGNTITGSIVITSNSVQPLISANKKVNGNISVSGNSTGVMIENNYIEDPANPNPKYGVQEITVIESIAFDNASTGTITKNVSGRIDVQNSSTVTIQDSFVLVEGWFYAVNVTDATCNVYRSFIKNKFDGGTYGAAGISNYGGALRVENSIIYAESMSTNGDCHGILSDNSFAINNNIIMAKAQSGRSAVAIVTQFGFAINYSTIYNNVFWLSTATNRFGINNTDASLHPRHIRNNYSINETVFYHGPDEGSGPNYTATALNALASKNMSGNDDAKTFAGLLYEGAGTPDFDTLFAFDFHIKTTSPLYQKAFNINNNDDYPFSGGPLSETEFRKCKRYIGVIPFSVGPYEPYADETECE